MPPPRKCNCNRATCFTCRNRARNNAYEDRLRRGVVNHRPPRTPQPERPTRDLSDEQLDRICAMKLREEGLR